MGASAHLGASAGGGLTLTLRATLTGHMAAVTHVAASHGYGIMVSGSADGTIILWDASKSLYVKTLLGRRLPFPVTQLAVSDTSGDILVAAGPLLVLCDVNGRVMAGKLTGTPIASACLVEVREWFDGKTIVTGHLDGIVRVWRVQFVPRRRAVVGATAGVAVGAGAGAGAGAGVVAASPPDGSVRPGFCHPDGANVPDSEKETSPGMAFLADVAGHCDLRLQLQALLPWHASAVTAVHVCAETHTLYSGDTDGNCIEWALDDDGVEVSD